MSDGIFLRTLRGEQTERRPLWMLRQAGRYLPEYRELRADHDFEAMSLDPEIAAVVTLQPIDPGEARDASAGLPVRASSRGCRLIGSAKVRPTSRQPLPSRVATTHRQRRTP